MRVSARPAALPVGDFRVGDWLAEPPLNRLTRGTTVLHVRPQLMDILLCLARRQGQVVLNDELLADVWPDRATTEPGVARCIVELRQLLGDDSHEPSYIETIAKRGYRLIAAVEWMALDRPLADSRPAPPPPPWWRRRPLILAAAAVGIVLTGAGALVTRRTRTAGLTERDLVVLAFENRSGDRTLDDPLPLALAIQLEQSPFLQIVTPEKIRHTLELMKRPPDTPITREVGLEVCERLGASAVIVGSLVPLGRDYTIGLEALACTTGTTIARRQTQVAGKDHVLGGLAGAASRLRIDLGESLVSVQEYDRPVVTATTSSLLALRALRLGDQARDRGQTAEALEHYREAAALDPEFALAHARVGVYALILHHEEESVASLQRAFALRSRASFPERLEIDLLYHASITGDQNRVTLALETMRRVYPRRLSARRRLAAQYLALGRFEESLGEALAAHRLEPTTAQSFTAVTRAYFALNRFVDARATAEQAIAAGVDSADHHVVLLQVGFLTNDAALVERERAWAATHEEAVPYFTEAEAEEALWRGRLRDSLSHLDRYQAWARQRGAEFRWIVLEFRKARFEALCGLKDRAVARMSLQLARPDVGLHLQVEALKVAVSAGDLRHVRRIITGLDETGWPRVEQPFAGLVLAYRAALETDTGHPERALELLEPMIPVELGVWWGLIPLHERARALLRTGDWEHARDAYEKMLAHPGVVSGQKLLPLAQLGVARAWAAGGDTGESRAAYEALFLLWKDADAGLPLLAQARREHARLR